MSVLLFAACISCISCVSEVKPLLKQREVSIPNRIADQEKWLKQDVAAKAITAKDARPVRDKLNEIKKKYNRLRSAGSLTAKDSEAINRMLDQTSDRIFRLNQQEQMTIRRR